MGLLDGELDQGMDAQIVSVASALIEKHGGVQGIVNQMEQQGLGMTVKSWVSNRANLPICADRVVIVFGADAIRTIAAKIELVPQDLAQRLAHALPAAINKRTPNGVVQPSEVVE